MPTTGLTLAELIRREQDSTGASYMDIARRSGLSKAKIGQLADPESRYQVRAETVQKLATGLKLPTHVVQRAALRTAGIAEHVGDERDSRIELMASQLAKLDDATLENIGAMIDAAARRATRGDG